MNILCLFALEIAFILYIVEKLFEIHGLNTITALELRTLLAIVK